MRYIYSLLDPDTLEIRYIGQTDNIKRRYSDHLRRSLLKEDNEYHTYKSRWIRKLLNNNKKPIIEVIDECISLVESNKKEKYWVDVLTKDGFRLTNSHVSDVTNYSKETRNKISNSRKGKKLEDIVGEDKAKELKKIFSKRMKDNNINKTDDPLVREKISNTLKEYYSNKENHWAYGLEMTEEHREKLRLAKLNNKNNVGNKKTRTEEHREKLRNSIKGKKIKRYKILQYNLEGEFIREWNSIREIERSDKTLSRKLISDCCKEKRNSYAGFIWKYKKED